mgnify:FL=1
MSFTQILAVIAARWRAVLLVTLVVTGLAATAVALLPKKYSAQAAVLVDGRGLEPVGTPGAAPVNLGANRTVMATQADLIGSERVARQVVRELGLAKDPDWHERWLDDTEGRGDEDSHLALLLLRKLDVKPARDSNVIRIGYSDADPARAAAIVNAVARAAIAANLDLRVEPAKQFSGWFETQHLALRRQFEAAQARLSAYQRERGMVVAGQGQIDLENAKLSQLMVQLGDIEAKRADSRSRRTEASGNTRQSADVVNSPVIAGLRTELTRLESQLGQLGSQLGDRHPQVESVRQQRNTLREQLEVEMKTVAASVGAENAVIERREVEARAAMEAQKRRVLSLTQGTDELAVLQRDVESARRALDQASARQSELALQSQLQQSNVYLLAQATEPGRPSFPRSLLTVALAAVLGVMLGAGVALWRESRNPVVRSAADLLAVIDLPLLATIPAAPSAGAPRLGWT